MKGDGDLVKDEKAGIKCAKERDEPKGVQECISPRDGIFVKYARDYISEEDGGWADSGKEKEPNCTAETHRFGSLGSCSLSVLDGCARRSDDLFSGDTSAGEFSTTGDENDIEDSVHMSWKRGLCMDRERERRIRV